ncbi:MAG: Acylglycerol lipase [Planctomycetaceae bacterium]|nr:Acylglycerol lipase [Planctomycetaceae bacterium]
MSNSPETPPDRRKPWFRWGLMLVQRCLVYYLVVVLFISIMQRSMIYGPGRANRLPVALARCPPGAGEEISLKTADGLQLHGWHLLPPPLTAKKPADFDRLLAQGRKVVLFFPGNGGHRGYRDLDFQLLLKLDVHVIAFDYRGYGENPGNPTEENFAADAHEMWKYVTLTRRVPPKRIILYGESLGGGVATRLASELCTAGTPPGGLILRSTFTSLIDAAGYHYPWLPPVSLLLKDRYQSDQRIPQMTAPLLMLHGTQDSIVPIKFGQRLFALAPEKSANGINKTFVELKRADHNDVMLTDPAAFQDAVAKFLLSLPGKR